MPSKVICMKTTIELPDALAREAKKFAREQGTTLRDLVVEGLRAEVDRRSHAPRMDFQFRTVGGRGLQLGIDPRQLTDLGYDLPT